MKLIFEKIVEEPMDESIHYLLTIFLEDKDIEEFKKNILNMSDLESLSLKDQLMRVFFGNNIERFLQNFKDYINNLDEKIKSIQTPIYSFITSNQQQITNNLTSLKESNLIAQTNQCKVIDELGDFLNKYKTNSAAKGLASENRLQILLNKMFPMSNVVDSRALKEAGDFLLKREGRPTILIENKNYEALMGHQG